MGKYLDVNSVLPESKSIRWISVAAISPDRLVAHLSPQMPPLLVPCSPGPSKQAPATSHPSSQDIVSKVDLFAGEDGGLEEKNESFAKKICVSKQYFASLVLQSKHQKSLFLASSNVIHKVIGGAKEKREIREKTLKFKVVQDNILCFETISLFQGKY